MKTLLTILTFATFLVGATAQEKAVEKKPEMKTLVEGNNAFAFDLFHRLSEQKGNVVFSPYSVSTALAMTYAGAKGNTAQEMAKTLHFPANDDAFHTTFGELIKDIQGGGKERKFQLNVANSLWGDKNETRLIPRFQNITQNDYQANMQLVDFVKDADGSRRIINKWVEDKTNKKITDLFPEDSLNSSTRLVLANAIYFKADWADPFTKDNTRDGDFTLADGKIAKVPMMHKEFTTRYMDNADFQLGQLSYQGNEMSMVVILPKKKDGLADVAKALTPKMLDDALAMTKQEELNVSLPRFKVTGESSLGQDLQALGIKDAFSGKADFSGMLSGSPVYISKVIHKAFVSVDEKGTEAAAATGVEMRLLSEKLKIKEPIPFHVDHPFLFILRHDKTGSILFVGQVVDPRGK